MERAVPRTFGQPMPDTLGTTTLTATSGPPQTLTAASVLDPPASMDSSSTATTGSTLLIDDDLIANSRRVCVETVYEANNSLIQTPINPTAEKNGTY